MEEKTVRGMSVNFLPCHMAMLILPSSTLGSQAQSFPEPPSFVGRLEWDVDGTETVLSYFLPDTQAPNLKI